MCKVEEEEEEEYLILVPQLKTPSICVNYIKLDELMKNWKRTWFWHRFRYI
jgi:hypothetical protein